MEVLHERELVGSISFAWTSVEARLALVEGNQSAGFG